MTTLHAINQRLRRRLKRDGETLCKARNERERMQFGEYFIRRLDNKWAMHFDVDPLSLAKELGVLRPGEQVEEADDNKAARRGAVAKLLTECGFENVEGIYWTERHGGA